MNIESTYINLFKTEKIDNKLIQFFLQTYRASSFVVPVIFDKLLTKVTTNRELNL
jgi:hypothetical protein